MHSRDWQRYADILDLYLQGQSYLAISVQYGISKERVRQIINCAAHQLAYRVFVGVPRCRWYFDRNSEQWKQMRR